MRNPLTHNICSPAGLALARATYGETVRRPLYAILLLAFSVAIFLSKFLTLFSFAQEINLVREMGMATLSFWSLVIIAVLSGTLVTQELEDRTAVTLLAKPIRRGEFLIAKFAGLLLALLPGLVVLSSVLLLTLWLMSAPHLAVPDADLVQNAERGVSPLRTGLAAVWKGFLVPEGGFVLGGLLLVFLQAVVMTAIAVSLSAFLPVVVTASALLLVFVLGNLAGYAVGAVENLGAFARGTARAAAYLFPNFGYFNLQTAFSEGKLVSIKYLGLATAYAGLYAAAVFLVSCALFRKREVR